MAGLEREVFRTLAIFTEDTNISAYSRNVSPTDTKDPMRYQFLYFLELSPHALLYKCVRIN